MSTSLQAKTELFSRPGTPLLDQIRLRHGPIAQLGRFFLLADQAAHERGLHLQLHTDMASLDVAYRELQPGKGVSVVSTFHPDHSDLSPANSFWISGHDDQGMLVATQAARCFDMTGTTMARELASLRLFYADPQTHMAAGMECQVDCPPADGISGRVVFSGCVRFHPKVRGCGLSRILPRISRALAYSTWNTDYTVSMLETVLIEKNVHQSYGYNRHAPSITLSGSERGVINLELVWMPQMEMLDDLNAYVSAAAGNEVRNTETTDTNWQPPRRQGSSNRS